MPYFSNSLIFTLGLFFLLLGLIFFYKHHWLLEVNKWVREMVFNDSLVLLDRHKKAALFLLIAGLFFYWGYHREHYTISILSDRLISTDRLLYQSLNHLYAKRYNQAKTLCERVLKREPNNAEALYRLAAAQFLMDDIRSGSTNWLKAYKLDPKSEEAARLKILIQQFRDPFAVPIKVLNE